jgi:hypothetical protein
MENQNIKFVLKVVTRIENHEDFSVTKLMNETKGKIGLKHKNQLRLQLRHLL